MHKDTAGPLAQCVADCALLDAVVAASSADADGGEGPPLSLSLEAAEGKDLKISVAQDWMDAAEPFLSKPLPASGQRAVEVAVAAFTKMGADVTTGANDSTFFVDVVEKLARHGLFADYKSDVAGYLDRHLGRADSGHEGSVDDVKASTIPCKTVEEVAAGLQSFHVPLATKKLGTGEGAPATAEELAEKLEERRLAYEAAELAYKKYFEDNGLSAVMVPTLGSEPCDVSGDEWVNGCDGRPDPPLGHMRATLFFTGGLTDLKVPSVSVPVPKGGGALPDEGLGSASRKRALARPPGRRPGAACSCVGA